MGLQPTGSDTCDHSAVQDIKRDQRQDDDAKDDESDGLHAGESITCFILSDLSILAVGAGSWW